MNQQTVSFQWTLPSAPSVNSLNFDALSLNDRRDTSSPPPQQTGGWGNSETRKAYSSLQALAEDDRTAARPCLPSSSLAYSYVGSPSTSFSPIAQQGMQSQQQQSDAFYVDDGIDMDEGNFW